MTIRVKPVRHRKPVAPRTCCSSHTDTCRFGREHLWSVGWIGGPLSGVGIGEAGWHDSALCITCKGICVADLQKSDSLPDANPADVLDAALADTEGQALVQAILDRKTTQ